MSPRNRRKRALKDRTICCFLCNYVISQRHHMLPVSVFGENQNTLELCANCHEAFHIFERAYDDILLGKEDTRNITLMLKIRFYWDCGNRRGLGYIERLCWLVQRAYWQQRGHTPSEIDPTWERFFAAHDQRRREGL